jgi:hypothetical protein
VALCSGAKGVDNPRIRSTRTFQRSRLWSSTSLAATTRNVPCFMFPLYPMLLFTSHAFPFVLHLSIVPFVSLDLGCMASARPFTIPLHPCLLPHSVELRPLILAHATCALPLFSASCYCIDSYSAACVARCPLPLSPLCSPVSPSSICSPFAIGPPVLP